MTQDRRKMSNHQELPSVATADRKRVSSPSSRLFGFAVCAVFMCGACQSPLPPLPNPPGPKTAVRLSPGDVIKLSFAEDTDLDQVQRIRRDGKISPPYLGEVTAAGKRVIDFQHELTRRYDEHLDNPEVLVTLENGAAAVV